MTKQFDDYEWHDAEVRKIQIDPPEGMKMWITFPDADEEVCLEFLDCYGFQADVNFGYIGSESIFAAYCLAHTSGLCRLRNNWKKSCIHLSELREYSFVTNTSNSELRIFARGYRITSG